MTLTGWNTPKSWMIMCFTATFLGGAVWGASRWLVSGEPTVELPKELTIESLKAGASHPGAMMSTIRSAMDRDDLTGEQRRQARQNMREVFESAINDRVNEYFAASDEEKTAVLDSHIDQMESWQKAMEEQRKQWEARRNQEGERGPGRGFNDQTREERKERSESRNPDQTAQRMAYFLAMQKRMAERGIQAPFGRGPGGMGGRRGP
jgi:hypothetical protein